MFEHSDEPGKLVLNKVFEMSCKNIKTHNYTIFFYIRKYFLISENGNDDK